MEYESVDKELKFILTAVQVVKLMCGLVRLKHTHCVYGGC